MPAGGRPSAAGHGPKGERPRPSFDKAWGRQRQAPVPGSCLSIIRSLHTANPSPPTTPNPTQSSPAQPYAWVAAGPRGDGASHHNDAGGHAALARWSRRAELSQQPGRWVGGWVVGCFARMCPQSPAALHWPDPGSAPYPFPPRTTHVRRRPRRREGAARGLAVPESQLPRARRAHFGGAQGREADADPAE